MTRARHPKRQARMDAVLEALRAHGVASREDLPTLALMAGCPYRALLCDLLALKREGAVFAHDDVIYANPSLHAAAAAA